MAALVQQMPRQTPSQWIHSQIQALLKLTQDPLYTLSFIRIPTPELVILKQPVKQARGHATLRMWHRICTSHHALPVTAPFGMTVSVRSGKLVWLAQYARNTLSTTSWCQALDQHQVPSILSQQVLIEAGHVWHPLTRPTCTCTPAVPITQQPLTRPSHGQPIRLTHLWPHRPRPPSQQDRLNSSGSKCQVQGHCPQMIILVVPSVSPPPIKRLLPDHAWLVIRWRICTSLHVLSTIPLLGMTLKLSTSHIPRLAPRQLHGLGQPSLVLGANRHGAWTPVPHPRELVKLLHRPQICISFLARQATLPLGIQDLVFPRTRQLQHHQVSTSTEQYWKAPGQVAVLPLLQTILTAIQLQPLRCGTV